MSTWTIFFSAFFTLCSYYFVVRAFQRRGPHPYPPGPPPTPIIGNALEIPLEKPWIAFRDMSKKHNSSLIHLSALGTHIVVVNTLEEATELFKRAYNYNGRPFSSLWKLLGLESLILYFPYSREWRIQRRLLQIGMKGSMPDFYNGQAEKVHLLLDQLLHDPNDFRQLLQSYSAWAILAMGFGYDVYPGTNDAWVILAEYCHKMASQLSLPGRTLVTLFGFLRHIPAWMPWASTQKIAARVRAQADEYKNVFYNFTKKEMADGTARDSILKRILEAKTKPDGTIHEEEEIKNALASIYPAGVEMLEIAQMVFVMAMALYPDVQKKAQEEIDRVVGTDRLPTMADRPSLPYIDAILRETLRWKPACPLGYPHAALEDDIYKGYIIPENAIILPNVWAMCYNEDVYPNPEVFRPERFFKLDGTLNDDTVSIAYGFGRRICAGKEMADSVLWHSFVSILATFNIEKRIDIKGNEVPIDSDACTNGFAVHPKLFKTEISPRSPQAESLIYSSSAIARDKLVSVPGLPNANTFVDWIKVSVIP